MNYIDRIALAIYNAGPDVPYMLPATITDHLDEDDLALARIYAVLALVKGEDVTNKDVHDAWSAWRAASYPAHRSIAPYESLKPAVQELDTPYTEAIRKVARELRARTSTRRGRVAVAARPARGDDECDDAYREMVAGKETHIGVTRGRKLYSVAFRRIWDGYQDMKPRLVVSLTHEERRELIHALEDRDDLEEAQSA